MILIIYIICFLSLFYLLDLKSPKLRESRRSGANDLVNYLIKYPQVAGEEVPNYKFYTKLINSLIFYRNKLGCEIRDQLIDIRKSLIVDIKESKKLKDALLGGYYQYFMMGLFLWLFLFASHCMVEVSISEDDILLLGLWHIIGLAVFHFCFKRMHLKYFKNFESYITCFYSFKILLGASRPLNEIINTIEIEKLEEDALLKHLKLRLVFICEQIKKSGNLNLEEVHYCLSELWDYFQLQFEKFNKMMNVVKLGLMFVFILPSYFFIIS